MSKINIENISGNNNVFGDNNNITYNYDAIKSDENVLTRNSYFQIILD